jgi:hypothetical protein
MMIAFKPDETFRGDFTYRNSPAAIRRFPFPFAADAFMYSVNIEPHTAGPTGSCFEFPIDVDEHYIAECRERAICLTTSSNRYLSLPHMLPAQWDVLELIMTSLARDYPDHFRLTRVGDDWTWTNFPLDIEHKFTFGNSATLPYEPLEYIARQTQGDWCLLDQRDESLWMDAGMVTTQADWSLNFDLGMNFTEWHGPVPVAHELGVFERALKFLMQLRVGHPVRRLNWTMTINPRLDTSPEQYPVWGPDRAAVTSDNVSRLVHLRVELQALWRLPRSNAIVFSIRCYLISLQELVTVPGWGRRLHRVLRDLHPALVQYKGLTRYRDKVVSWLASYDDGGAGVLPAD